MHHTRVLLMVLFVGWGGYQVVVAERDQAFLQRSRALAHEAGQAQAEGKPDRAYLLAAQAVRWPEGPAHARPEVAEARTALLTAAAELVRREVETEVTRDLDRVDYVQGTVTLAAVTRNETVKLWTIDPAAGTASPQMLLPADAVVSEVWLSADGGRFLALDRAGIMMAGVIGQEASLRRLVPPALRTRGPDDMPDLAQMTFCQGGKTVLLDLAGGTEVALDGLERCRTTIHDRVLGSWLVSSRSIGTAITVLALPPETEASQRVGDDEDRLLDAKQVGAAVVTLSASRTGRVRVWSSDPARRFEFNGGTGVRKGWLSPDGTQALLARRGRALLWSATAAAAAGAVAVLPLPDLSDADNAGFSRDGRRAFVTYANRIAVFGTGAGSRVAWVQPDSIGRLAMDHSGRYLALFPYLISRTDGIIYLWDVDLLLDDGALVAAAERELRRRLDVKEVKCLPFAELMWSDAAGEKQPAGPEPLPTAAGRHACPVAPDYQPAQSSGVGGFARDLFRAVFD